MNQQALLLNGTVGAGKTTVAEAVGDVLVERGVHHAIIDLDWLRRCWPAPAGDPFNVDLCLRNVAAVAANAREAGSDLLVIAGVIETRDERDRMERAVGVPLTVCRLVIDAEVARRRLVLRHHVDQQSLNWHLNRVAELDRILEEAGLDDVVIPVGTRTPRDIARDILVAIGRPPAGTVAAVPAG